MMAREFWEAVVCEKKRDGGEKRAIGRFSF